MAVQQLEKTAEEPGMRLAVGLPDLQPGKGSPIGAAFAVEGWLYPALVGNDIGCGIGLWRTEVNGKKMKREGWEERLRNLDEAWEGDASEFLGARGVEPSGCEHCLGTIGSGNHFAELQAVESIQSAEACMRLGIHAETVCLCVHSGSRGFGEAILREHVSQFGFGGLIDGSDEASHYLSRHKHARRWAAANRELIATRMLERLETRGDLLLDVWHNCVVQPELGF